MIFNLILLAIYAVVWALLQLLNLLPVLTFPPEFITSLNSIAGYVAVVDNFLPTSTFFAIIGLMLAVEGGILIFKIITWIIKKIPGIS